MASCRAYIGPNHTCVLPMGHTGIHKDEDMLVSVTLEVEPGSSDDPFTQHQLSLYKDPFDDILKEMSELHNKKGSDYGSGTDPYANVRAASEFGVPAWLGTIVRLNDKITRIKSFTRKGNLANESLEDSLKDIAVYAVIAQILYREENPQ